MKQLILFVLLLSISFQSCDKDEVENMNTDETAVNDTLNNEVLQKILEGTFIGQNGYPASGNVILGKNTGGDYFLSLQDNFATSFATGSVTIYLSKEMKLKLSDTSSFIRLGVINKNGKHTFKLNDAPESAFKFAIVWCSPAAIQFGVSELK